MSKLTDDEKLAVAARATAASRGDDPDAQQAVYAPGAVVWHNFDEIELDAQDATKNGAWLKRTVPDLAYEDQPVVPTATGYVARSVLTGTAPGGPLRLHSCLVVTLDDDGLITRIDEYLDTAQSRVLRGG